MASVRHALRGLLLVIIVVAETLVIPSLAVSVIGLLEAVTSTG